MTTERPTSGLPSWDDQRLAAAFADRYDRPAPRELTIATVERIRVTPRQPRWWPTLDRRAAISLTSVATVVAILAVLTLPRAGGGPGASIIPSGAPSTVATTAQNSPYESFPPSPAVAGFAATATGLVVRSVADVPPLLAEPTLGDTELAIAGWYSASDLIMRCAYRPMPLSPIEQVRCGMQAWLSSSASPFLAADGTPTFGAPRSSVELRFAAPVHPIIGSAGPNHAMVTTPRPVILIGHFNDERSVRCTSPAICDRAFVVDAVASAVGDVQVPASSEARGFPTTRLSGDAATGLARAWVGLSGQVLSIGLVHGSDAPWFMTQVVADCRCPPTWFVRGYRILAAGTSDPRGAGTPVAGWLTIDDATGDISGTLDHGGNSIPPPIAGFPETVDGLPVRTVASIAGLDLTASADRRPIAVGGWLSQLPIHPCPTGGPACDGGRLILSGSDRKVVIYTGSDVLVSGPDPDALKPVLLLGGPTPPVANPDGSPHRVVLLMHRDDLRANANGPGDPVGPTDWVIDQIAWLDGVDQPRSVWIEPGIKPTRTLDDVFKIAGPIQTGRTWTISISAVSAAHLRAIGSWMTTEAKGIVWLIRLVGSNPLDPNSGPNGWGAILVDDATGEFRAEWSTASP